jgi:hypothetical protein
MVWIGIRPWVEDSRRPTTLWAAHPKKGLKAVSGVALPQGIEGQGRAGPGETLGSSWPPLAIRPCTSESSRVARLLFLFLWMNEGSKLCVLRVVIAFVTWGFRR